MLKYAHLELNTDVPTPSGYYTPQKEVRLKYDGQEVLYVISQVVVEASCCGVTDYSYSLVPGYILKWQAEKNQDSTPVTEVEPIKDEKTREDIKNIIQKNEHVLQTEFW